MINAEQNVTETIKWATQKLYYKWDYGTLGGIMSTFVAFLTDDKGPILLSLIVIMIIDWITGVLAALRRGEKVSSSKMVNGLIKIALYILCMIGSIHLDKVIASMYQVYSSGALASFVIGYIGIIEVISILENLKSAGLNVPDKGVIGKIFGPVSSITDNINDIDKREELKPKNKNEKKSNKQKEV